MEYIYMLCSIEGVLPALFFCRCPWQHFAPPRWYFQFRCGLDVFFSFFLFPTVQLCGSVLKASPEHSEPAENMLMPFDLGAPKGGEKWAGPVSHQSTACQTRGKWNEILIFIFFIFLFTSKRQTLSIVGRALRPHPATYFSRGLSFNHFSFFSREGVRSNCFRFSLCS